MIVELTEQGRQPRRFEGWSISITDGVALGPNTIEVKRGGVTERYTYDPETTGVRFIPDPGR